MISFDVTQSNFKGGFIDIKHLLGVIFDLAGFTLKEHWKINSNDFTNKLQFRADHEFARIHSDILTHTTKVSSSNMATLLTRFQLKWQNTF